ncbi:MAG: hypothetical protein OEU86_02955 [Gammaproteobacteria bacterium]|nr:hypothetical protein [Gammaproteobacteria bacterium]
MTGKLSIDPRSIGEKQTPAAALITNGSADAALDHTGLQPVKGLIRYPQIENV